MDKDINIKSINEITKDDKIKYYDVVGVIFEITKKKYYFQVEKNNDYKKEDKVLVETSRGLEIGTVYSDILSLPEDKLVLPLKPVIKKAVKGEIEKYLKQQEEANEAEKVCKKLTLKFNLPMKLVATEYTYDKTKLIFYFTAEGRIDFRELVKELANLYKVRIELRQIGVRDESRILGTIGICGQELCCRRFLNKFDSVSIKMARDQGLVINPSKISGTCGRLLCCLNYEFHLYEEALKNFPGVNQIVNTPEGEGKVINIAPLNGNLTVSIRDKGIYKFNVSEVEFDKKIASRFKETNIALEDKKLRELEKE